MDTHNKETSAVMMATVEDSPPPPPLPDTGPPTGSGATDKVAKPGDGDYAEEVLDASSDTIESPEESQQPKVCVNIMIIVVNISD